MLESLLGRGSELDALKQLIIKRTEGNPFFIEESVQVLLDNGALVNEGGIRLTKPLAELKIPPTVQAILAARIDRLPGAEKELLHTVAVIGKDFSLDIAREVSGKSEEALGGILTNLQLGEFIYEQPAFGGPEYTFKHALTHEVAYNSMLAGRRRAIHERTARAIEKLRAGQLENQLSEIAHHFLMGQNAAKAIHYAALAAQQDLDRAAYREANSTITAALPLLDKIPKEEARMRAELSLRAIQPTLAFVLYGSSSPQREEVVARVYELGERVGSREQLLAGLINLVQLSFTQGESLRGLKLTARCIELAESLQNAELLADSRWGAALTSESCGFLAEAASHYERGIQQSSSARWGRISLWGVPWRTGIRGQAANTLQLLGRLGDARRHAEEALAYARESGHLFGRGLALASAGGWLGRYRRTPEIVLDQAEEQIALALENSFAEWLPWGRFHRGWALSELGKADEGIAEMETGIAGFRSLGGVPRMQYAIASLARHYARRGRIEEALTMLDETIAHVERSGEKVDLPDMLRMKGEILLLHDTRMHPEAEGFFREAFNLAVEQGAKWWELRVSVSLARLLRDTNRGDEASANLSAIYGRFTEGFELPDMQDAKALLDELT